jgi:hypothetical protein
VRSACLYICEDIGCKIGDNSTREKQYCFKRCNYSTVNLENVVIDRGKRRCEHVRCAIGSSRSPREETIDKTPDSVTRGGQNTHVVKDSHAALRDTTPSR